jgi:ribosome-binding protein aMBF1 (putative translation factor)
MRGSAQDDVRSCRSCGRAIRRTEPFPLEQALMDHCYRCTQVGATCRCVFFRFARSSTGDQKQSTGRCSPPSLSCTRKAPRRYGAPRHRCR